MSELELASETLDAITGAGFDKATCQVRADELHELQAETGDINLFRTNFETDIYLSGIEDQKQASLSINKTDRDSIHAAIDELKTMAAAANPDPARDIAEAQPPASFVDGVDEPDYDAMYDRIVEFQRYAAETYPTLNIRAVSLTFAKRRSSIVNSNGVRFETQRGLYRAGVQFSSKTGGKTSSMMYTGYSTLDPETPIHRMTNVDELLRQSTQQVETKHIPGKFVGDLLITPNCLDTFLGFILQRISDGPLISGTSVYRDKLGELVTSPSLTVQSMPLSDELAAGYRVTGGGYLAQNATVIEDGRLKEFMLSLYGANKTGLGPVFRSGGCWVIEPGDVDYEALVAGVAEGILITRFSGGRPNDRGDFSGIAKNSYYIRDGQVRFPIKETTVSGNLVDLWHSVEGVSKERLNFGDSIEPWVRVSGVTAS